MIAYVALFASALIAATILPMQSEAVLVGLLIEGQYPVLTLLIVATVGNVLGSVVNWYIGRFLLRFKDRRWFPASDHQLARAERWYRRAQVGDPLTVMAGVLREPLVSFVLLVTLAKGTRYVFLATLTLAWLRQS